MAKSFLTNKDLSWLHFNRRVLEEAASEQVPLLERLNFLSIFSSNLDEFYRVKMPPLLALQKIRKKKSGLISKIDKLVLEQQKRFGFILDDLVIPDLRKSGIYFLNTEPIPEELNARVRQVFFNEVAGMLEPVLLSQVPAYFARNNQLYLLVILKTETKERKLALVNIPTEALPRFHAIEQAGKRFVIFLDDIIRCNLQVIFPTYRIHSAYTFKITRDAELNLTDDYQEDIAAKIEKQLQKRDYGLATRFLYQPGIPARHWPEILEKLNLQKGSLVAGGVHHGLKDLATFPLKDKSLEYPAWTAVELSIEQSTLMDEITVRDLMLHTPYHHYNTVLRLFNEAALNPDVQEIYTTLYRIAGDSRIARALICAARNGKQVTVLVELKARFDEENNLRWSKRMKEAGVKIIYSSNNIKVHAKIALIVRRHVTHPLVGLLATGNLNENTARVYTDHILLSANQVMLSELKMLFDFLATKQKPDLSDKLAFNHLLVSQFNLQRKFLALMDREIAHATIGKKACISIKLNNLEEEKLIRKLYKASRAGVKVNLMVRGICCLKPGIKGLSENITVKRVVDRYLEHGRVFRFENGGNPELYMGSSDWMNRNIYRRIEVCFPVYDESVKKELMKLLEIQLSDNVQAVWIDENGENQPVSGKEIPVRSQEAIYHYLKERANNISQ
jgi:polyphosphate kinase